MFRRVALVVPFVVLVACQDGDKGAARVDTPSPGDTSGDVAADTPLDTEPVFPDTEAPPDTAVPDADTGPSWCDADGAFGCACVGNDDCLDELCIEGPDGNFCTKPCVAECPDGFACLNTSLGGPDPISICVPRHTRLCRPCDVDADCQNPLDPVPAACVEGDEPRDGSFCATSCAQEACPADYDCEDVPVGDTVARLCRPSDDTCECRPAWAELGLTTGCRDENDVGVCHGERSCEPGGLSACSARVPSVETCDLDDEDCSGAPDDIAPEPCAIENGFGICQGLTSCSDGEQACSGTPASAERCNFLDDDCDGETDETWTDCPLPDCVAAESGFVETGESTCTEGHCVSPSPRSCGLYTCEGGGDDGVLCAAACVDDTTCVAGAHCDETTSRCVPDILDGAPCVEAGDCASAHCRNGFCCADGDCCKQPDDCPAAYREAPRCDTEVDCQGTRKDARCIDSVCSISAPVDDDSGCGLEIMALDCAPLDPIYCAGTVVQEAPICGNACADDGDCVEGFHCDGTCRPDAGDGGVCDEDSDCQGDHCQNGFCCDTGDCCAVANDCPDAYRDAAECRDTVTCQGDRIDAVCADNQCDSETVPDDAGCDEGIEAIDCTPYDPVFCSGSVAQTPPRCPVSCASDDACAAGFHCDTVCIPDLPDGNFCDEPSDCVSAYCNNNICCVGGDCCNLASDCPATFTGTASCDFPTTCQGSRNAASCTSHVCATVAGSADDSACDASVIADECGPYPSVSCTGQLDQQTPACARRCDSNSQCDANAFCDGDECAARRPDGSACTDDAQCAAGHCQNGFCCASGDCCAQPGDCPASYDVVASCDSAATCQGTRRDRECVDAMCATAAPGDDDSDCDPATLALDCSPYVPRYCSGTADQQAPTCPTACTNDADCIDGYHCDGSCVADVADGGACDEDTDCGSGYCANDFCCEDGDCCSQATDCPAAYRAAAACQDTLACQGERVDARCVDSTCESQTVGDDSSCDSAQQARSCSPFKPVFCSGGASQTPPLCPTSCSADSECEGNAHCDTACVLDVADGGTCDEASDCTSGHCDNGLCCSGGDCCNQSSDCPGSYTADATCDFPATCQGSRDTAVCTGHVCDTADNSPNDMACTSSVVANECGYYPAVSCTGANDQVAPSCPTSCDANSKCDANAFCDAGKCAAKKADGQACTDGAQCAAGHCQNGFCCATGDCCSIAGNCSTSTYGRPSACEDATSCNGTRRDPVCQQSMCQLGATPVADDSGCSGQEKSSCGYYDAVFCSAAVDQGGGPTCATSCGGDSVCDNGAHCEDGACRPDQGIGEACGPTSQCQGGLTCVDGVCCGGACTGTCQACNLAGNLGVCATIDDGADPSSECGEVACTGYYWGFEGSTCYRRDKVSAATAACDGTGACDGPEDVCPGAGKGAASSPPCHADCQVPTAGTCSGTTPGACTNVTGGLQTCGVGECTRKVDRCEGGNYKTCLPGNPTAEICDGLDNDCDGQTDEASDLVLVACGNQQGVCAGAMRPASLCVSGQWLECDATVYEAHSGGLYEDGRESLCETSWQNNAVVMGLDNDCDGTADEDFSYTSPAGAVVQGAGNGCGVGVCAGGKTVCGIGRALVCTTDTKITTETCDGQDNDCDAKLDSLDSSMQLVQCGNQSGVCSGSMRPASLCSQGTWQACTESTYSSYSAAYCSSETTACGTAKGCDAKDNDCDGLVDSADPQLVAPDNTNQTGACDGSKQKCTAGGWLDDYSSVPGYDRDEVPNGSFADENCDGIDGDVGLGLFVTTTGSGDACSQASPCTLATALTKVSTLKPHIYLRAGTYGFTDITRTNARLYGGYSGSNWVRGTRTNATYRATFNGSGSTYNNEHVALRVAATGVVLDNIWVTGPNATTRNGLNGRSSYGIYATSATLTVSDSTINGGSGNGGDTGSSGASNWSGAAPGGTAGTNGYTDSRCNDSRRAGGPAGSQTCGTWNADGGGGGAGGATDDTSSFWCAGTRATDGLSGSSAANTSGSYGTPGGGGTGGDTCGVGGGGRSGIPGGHGSGGGGGSGGAVSNNFWYGDPGDSGTRGSHGGGGGGGGGSGGCDIGSPDASGAGGGGGGAGGCLGPNIGGGGGGGGGSFGIFAVNTTLTVTGSTFTRGRGGAGGTGGTGGVGQTGGSGGAGGIASPSARNGGAGGPGGNGGNSGAGGGGAGGISYCVYRVGGSYGASNVTYPTTVGDGGSGGNGGSGGVGGVAGGTGTSGNTFP